MNSCRCTSFPAACCCTASVTEILPACPCLHAEAMMMVAAAAAAVDGGSVRRRRVAEAGDTWCRTDRKYWQADEMQ
jgi:hypothetical protein